MVMLHVCTATSRQATLTSGPSPGNRETKSNQQPTLPQPRMALDSFLTWRAASKLTRPTARESTSPPEPSI